MNFDGVNCVVVGHVYINGFILDGVNCVVVGHVYINGFILDGVNCVVVGHVYLKTDTRTPVPFRLWMNCGAENLNRLSVFSF